MDINDWLAPEYDHRDFLKRPHYYKGKTICSNSKILLTYPDYSNNTENAHKKVKTVVDNVLQIFKTKKFKSLPKIKFPKKHDCIWCDGNTTIPTKSGKEIKCRSCYGFGYQYPILSRIEICGQLFNSNYLKLISNEPKVTYCISEIINCTTPIYALFFKTGEYFGLIMPINRAYEYDND